MAARYVWQSRTAIVESVYAARDIVTGFVTRWLVEPIRCVGRAHDADALSNLIATIRYGSDGLSLVSRESLDSNLDSLARMVEQFAVDAGEADAAKELGQRARSGDISVVLRAYEAGVRRPIRSAVGGDLVRAILVQVQVRL